MADIIDFEITHVGDLNIDEECYNNNSILDLNSLSNQYFKGNLLLTFDNYTYNINNVKIFKFLLDLFNTLHECLSSVKKNADYYILDQNHDPILKIEFKNYIIYLGYANNTYEFDFKEFYNETCKALKKIFSLMYHEHPILALNNLNENRFFEKIRDDWVLDNFRSLPYKIRKDLLFTIGKPFLL
ncbi:hypothetical protein [Pseudemcibacter aquimaris]|uniref:hypothetical protein n=1 Tax=Pseudemcibacter aquimaris TaxID=2857064 RepID=UPI0020123143|nr:hypothetical protein [Pseudemcibacter aquimaris]MCC3860042.1 hypothetical protein [Pseudemcibacter aquimaris]WDU57372.1 hypothetical protein KW060_09190 [Pseudemcibacter aquimaris]